jgi:hypothetical protein
MKLDPVTADVRELAKALRRECNAYPFRLLETKQFAVSLLAVLDECEEWRKIAEDPTDGQMNLHRQLLRQVIRDIIRAAAAAFVKAGGELEG